MFEGASTLFHSSVLGVPSTPFGPHTLVAANSKGGPMALILQISEENVFWHCVVETKVFAALCKYGQVNNPSQLQNVYTLMPPLLPQLLLGRSQLCMNMVSGCIEPENIYLNQLFPLNVNFSCTFKCLFFFDKLQIDKCLLFSVGQN